jgi:hypothetical protein
VVDAILALLATGIGDRDGAVVVSEATILLAMFAGVPFALLVTPTDEQEGETFSSVGKAVTAFASGWLLSKLDGTATAMFIYDNLTPLSSFRIAAFLTCFILSVTITYALRQYADWVAIKQKFRSGSRACGISCTDVSTFVDF